MNFFEAKAKLKKMANGEYHTLRYTLSESDGTQSQLCSVYIHGGDWIDKKTWHEAFEVLAERMCIPSVPVIEYVEELPTGEPV